MLGLLAAFVLTPPIERDAFGVPHIVADSWGDAFYSAGYAVAEDRLWQMENSRRLARGRMAEVFGPDFAASDREILRLGYTEQELQKQVSDLPEPIREAFERYAQGVTAYMEDAAKSAHLPEGYAKNGFSPTPWTPADSAAIAVRLFQQFGRGGAGEIRNLALMGYLATQPALKGRELDVVDDFAWFNDSRAVTTVQPKDDPIKRPPTFFVPSRKDTEAHLAALPKLSLFELLPGLRLAEREESTRVAESVAAPFKVGSYCIAVAGSRSANGRAILLSGPQMGFQSPSIVHEMSIRAPGLAVVGADVPGVPGVVIGHSERLAWGLTSGVADTDDIFYSETAGDGKYKDGAQTRDLEVIRQPLRVKGKPDETVEQVRTKFGPVVLAPRGKSVVFSRRASAWMRELESMQAMYGLYKAKHVSDADQAATHATVNFNVFAADVDGNIAYRYGGLVPIRASGVDPRFPTPASADWGGFVPIDQMPHAKNPASGLFVNWNNKPVAWWPNADTPVWGRIFRNQVLLDRLGRAKLTTDDLELAIWAAARTDYNYAYFTKWSKGVTPDLDAFEGLKLDGSRAAGAYLAWFDALREEIFLPVVGSMMTADNFKLAIQPSVMLAALEGKTKFPYLGKRTAPEIAKDAADKAAAKLGIDEAAWRYAAPGIRVTGQPPIPYSDRGTYIQIVELLSKPLGRSVLPPGVSETGDHSQDQVSLSRAWTFKPMLLP